MILAEKLFSYCFKLITSCRCIGGSGGDAGGRSHELEIHQVIFIEFLKFFFWNAM